MRKNVKWMNFPHESYDIDGDGVVNFDDLVTLLASWGSCSGCDADIDDNGDVDFNDVLILLGNWS